MSSARVIGILATAGSLATVAGAATPLAPVKTHACGIVCGERAAHVAGLERMMFGALPADQQQAILEGMARAGLETEAAERISGLMSDETYEAMRPEWKRAMDMLARGEGKGVAFCFTPDTPVEVAEAFDTLIFSSANRFQLGNRWSSTAISGGGLDQGDPTVVTYGFVPDGTFIEDAGFGGGGSDLFSWLNGIYGSPADWQPLFHQVFDRWEELSGISYVFESNDDGANHSSNGNSGIEGVRADVRIGAKRIDGNSGVLAYNFFPNNGDMVLDSDDSFYNNTGLSSLRLRNVIAHEHGHGKGMAHVCPANQTKLMEPFISIAYDGPQLDDRLHAQRHYGDVLEPNDNAATATDLGTPFFFNASRLSVDDNGDSDWFRVDFTEAGELTVLVNPTGDTYLDGPQNSNGSCSAGSPYNSLTVHDLKIDIVDDSGFVIIDTADDGAAGESETISYVAEDPQTVYVRVTGGSTNSIQAYNISANVEDLPFIPARVELVAEAPDELEPGVTTTVQVTIDPNDENVQSSALLFRANPGDAFQTVPLTPVSGEIFSAEIPAAACGDNPEFYFELTTDLSGTITLPDDGAAGAFEAIVGEFVVAFEDNFETNQGWTVSGNINSGNAGRWQRGTPAAGGDDRVSDPPQDADGSGQCYVTGNISGNSDVDDGTTILTSPAFAIDGQTEAVLSYSRWFDNNEGGDAANPFTETFVIEISNNNGASWTNLETVGPNGSDVSGGWVDVSFRVADFVTPTDQVRVRFIASDDTGTIVEAGVDAVSIESLECEDPMSGPCNAADIAEPFEILDLADINAFVAGFTSQNAAADLAAPFGVFDLADINAFVAAFSDGCP